MAATLLGAITELFQGDSFLSATVPESPWLDESREGVDPPYVVVTGIREESDATDFERENETESWWTFRIIGLGEAAVEALAVHIDAVFNWSETRQSLAVTNRNLLSVIRRRYTVALQATRDPQARRVTEAQLSYQARWEEVIP
jgi:hypothetical protein